LALIKLGLHLAREGQFITDYDVTVARKLAYVVCGGNLSGCSKVGEQYLLELEREAFLSLCGEKKTQERIAHMLKTGKPLRN
jgi:3-hydroxyacyl-CoA dehydrogenase